MADSITKCVSFYDGQNILDYRVVHYQLGYANYRLDISVIIRANEMTNPNDLDECRLLANAKAAEEKNRWISSLALGQISEEEVTDLNGSVSV